MYSVSIEYALVWRFKDHPQYCVTRCRKIVNTKTGKQLSITYNSGSLGIWMGKKFIPVSKMNKMLERIPKPEYPF